jgi:flagellar M-ring protein FliF
MDQFKKVYENIKKTWSGTSKKVKQLVIGMGILVLVVALAMTILINVKDYVPIFEDLSVNDSNEILAQLKSMDYDIKIDNSGTILVPSADESKIRMELATAGYPKDGLSYSLIKENNSMLTTDYQRKQYESMQLQERIGASIETLDGVSSAVATISAPSESAFYLQDEKSTTASVIIHMTPGNNLTQNQVYGIQNLVSKSVSGLSKDDIALSDSEGNDLTSNISAMSANTSKLTVTRQIEEDIKRKVVNVLNGPYESSKYKIAVSAIVNTDALKKELVVYTPSSDGDNTGVINQESTNINTTGAYTEDGGVAGTTSNSEVTTYVAADGTTIRPGVDMGENYTYSVSSDTTQTERLDPVVESVSIGIALDDINLNATERENLIQLVAFSAGVVPESITVRNFDFYTQEEKETVENEIDMNQLLIYGGIIGGALLLLIVLLIIVMSKSKRRKKLKALTSQEGASFDSDEPMDELFGEVSVKQQSIKAIEPVKDDKKDKIKEFAQTNPEIAAQLLKSWLKNDNE